MLVKLIIEREIGNYINIDDAGQSMLGVCATFDGNAQDFVRVLDDHHLEQFVVVVDHWSIDHLSFAAMGPPKPKRFICEFEKFDSFFICSGSEQAGRRLRIKPQKMCSFFRLSLDVYRLKLL